MRVIGIFHQLGRSPILHFVLSTTFGTFCTSNRSKVCRTSVLSSHSKYDQARVLEAVVLGVGSAHLFVGCSSRTLGEP